MKEQDVEVTNSLGIHARPSSMIVKTAQQFTSSITISKEGADADAKSIMSVMMLAATCGSKVTVRVSGDDEEQALEAIVGLFTRKFDEE